MNYAEYEAELDKKFRELYAQQLPCICCASREYCNLLDIGEFCCLEYFQPSDEFLLFVNDLVAPLTKDGSSDEAEI